MKRIYAFAFIILMVIGLLSLPVSAYMVTLVGEVNDNNQFVADNEIYEVDNNAVGDDLVVNYIAEKVKLVGILKHTRKSKIITVESFEVIEQ
jgi:hypothetical protein